MDRLVILVARVYLSMYKMCLTVLVDYSMDSLWIGILSIYIHTRIELAIDEYNSDRDIEVYI